MSDMMSVWYDILLFLINVDQLIENKLACTFIVLFILSKNWGVPTLSFMGFYKTCFNLNFS